MNKAAKKGLFIKTYGCQMNVYDSERMADLLNPLGYDLVDSVNAANMVILNTCHIREKAAEKLYSDLGRIKPFKEEKKAAGQEFFITVAGCVAQAEGEEVLRRAPYVDMVVGPQTYHRLPELIAQAHRKATPEKRGVGLVDVDFPAESKFDALPEMKAHQGYSAFLSVQEGCDKFCHFCVVPYTRGAEYSRPVADVVRDAQALVAQGVREITLLGQNVNAYHGASPAGGEWTLGELLRHLGEIEGLDRLRYTTSHPRDVDDSLILAHRDVPQLMPYLHLPVQSGSDRILEAMNRKHTASFYLELVDKFREARPDLAFSSDFIVGYPGETDADFEATLDLVRRVTYAQAYSFKYSPRPGTPAAAMDGQLSEIVMDERLQTLQAVLREQQTAFNASMVGRTLPVLFEKKGRHTGQLIGRSPYLQSVHAEANPRLLGQLVDVRIVSSSLNSLTGVIATGEYESINAA
ncbi:MAG: tRNA (N6-isopentenyl adenosine(37)-C2)-methylthiotransferase MiaB [Holosporales bacterium]